MTMVKEHGIQPNGLSTLTSRKQLNNDDDDGGGGEWQKVGSESVWAFVD